MGDDFINIDWATFGKTMQKVPVIKKVKTKTGGTAIVRALEDRMVKHNLFLSLEEAQQLTHVTNAQWTDISPDWKATGHYGQYTMDVPNVGRFCTDHKVGEILPYGSPPVKEGFVAPLFGGADIELEDIDDVEVVEPVTAMMTTDNITQAEAEAIAEDSVVEVNSEGEAEVKPTAKPPSKTKANPLYKKK